MSPDAIRAAQPRLRRLPQAAQAHHGSGIRLSPPRDTRRSARGVAVSVAMASLAASAASGAAAQSAYASSVISYAAGTGAQSGFTNPASALGMPERFSGEGLIPGCVTPFQPAFRPNELVSIGVGGSLVLAFDHDVEDDPRNPFGVDLIVFGNAFFTDSASGQGVVGGLAAEGGSISVSQDGIVWHAVPGVAADGLFPTLGYLDAPPYATQPGTVESDFLRPVDPGLSLSEVVGADHWTLVDLYAGSGGGAGIDLAPLGLAWIRFVRIAGPGAAGFSPEIDAVSDVAPVAPSPDLDGSGDVGAADLAMLLALWGTVAPSADLDSDGSVGAGDLSALLAAWSAGGRR